MTDFRKVVNNVGHHEASAMYEFEARHRGRNRYNNGGRGHAAKLLRGQRNRTYGSRRMTVRVR